MSRSIWIYYCSNCVGFKSEEESCPYAWLPFTGEHHKQVQNLQDLYDCSFSWSVWNSQPSSNYFLVLPAGLLPQIHYTKINITFLEKFGPVFATEGESATLTATMSLDPNLANLQPEAQWYRDGNYENLCLSNYTIIVSNIYTLPAAVTTSPNLCWHTAGGTDVENCNMLMDTNFIALIKVKVAIWPKFMNHLIHSVRLQTLCNGATHAGTLTSRFPLTSRYSSVWF